MSEKDVCQQEHNCDGNCSSCGEASPCSGVCSECGSKEACASQNLKLNLNEYSHIKSIIGVVSGKGGVGKSLISSLLAVTLAQKGLRVGIMDADITGPSIAKTFNIKQKAYGQNNLIYPFISEKFGIKIISSNMMLENDDDPIIWRGSLISSLVQQFYKDVLWGELDVLLIDMPPGTGDVALTTFQSIPLNGIVMVTSPQDLVSLIVSKACKMAEMMNVNILGVVENMAYVECPNCGEKIYMYGKSKTDEMLKPYNLKVVSSLPINPNLTELVNKGAIENYSGLYLEELANQIISKINLGEGD